MATGDFPRHFEGSFPEFKERQLVFALTRQLAEAQFLRGDRQRAEQLWQEAAAEDMDPERITSLLYAVEDHADTTAMDEVDRPFREQQRQAALKARSALSRLSRFTQRRPEAPHRRGSAARAMTTAGRAH